MSLENFTLNGVDLNDGSVLSVTDVVFTPAQAQPQWAANPNADGSALVAEPHFTDAIFDLTVRVRQASTATVAFERLGEVTDAVQSCARIEDGAPLEWLPKDTSTTYTAYAKLGEISEIPTDQEGWLLRSPVVKVRLTCRPFLYTESRVVQASTESGAEPQQTLYLEVGGDVWAEAELIVTDKSSQDRRYFKVGRDMVDSKEGNPSTLILAESLVTSGFSGEAKTRSGAYGSEKVKRATVVSQPVTVCGTGGIAHVGSFRVYARVYASTYSRFRLSYKNGDGPLTPSTNPGWVTPATDVFSLVDLGEVHLDEAQNGEQRSELRIEAKNVSGSPGEVDVNYLTLIPITGGLHVARGTTPTSTPKLLAYDSFEQAEGNLDAPKALPLGGNWSEATKTGAAGFKVIASTPRYARRTETKDADLQSGSYAIAGTSEPVTAKVSVLTASSVLLLTETWQRGVFLRYTSSTNVLKAVLVNDGSGLNGTRLRVSVGGGELDSASVPSGLQTTSAVVSLYAAANGVWKAWAYREGESEPAPLLEGYFPGLAEGSGEAIAKGKAGMYDAYTGEAAATRTFDQFSLLEGDPPGRVCYSGRSCRLTSDGFSRQDSTGAYEGPASLARGMNLYLEPASDKGQYNRLVIAARRNDVVEESDANVVDKHASEVIVRERYLAPR